MRGEGREGQSPEVASRNRLFACQRGRAGFRNQPVPAFARTERPSGKETRATAENARTLRDARDARASCSTRASRSTLARAFASLAFSIASRKNVRAVAPDFARTRARARRATYLDLGRLEGGDRAGEGGGNAGHCCCLVFGRRGVCVQEWRSRRATVKKQNIFSFFANHHGQTDSKRPSLIGREAPTETR